MYIYILHVKPAVIASYGAANLATHHLDVAGGVCIVHDLNHARFVPGAHAKVALRGQVQACCQQELHDTVEVDMLVWGKERRRGRGEGDVQPSSSIGSAGAPHQSTYFKAYRTSVTAWIMFSVILSCRRSSPAL